MTREQIEILLVAKQELQKHLDERFNILDNMSKEFKSAGKLTDALIIGNRAEVYNALGLVCAAEVGTYQAMIAMMDMQVNND